MGTNYFHRTAICECCGQYDELHIGKSSGGWQFSFRGYVDVWGDGETEEIRTYQGWLTRLEAGGKIFTQYGQEISLEDFKAFVEQKKSEPLNHTIYCRTHHPGHAEQSCWLDPEGHSFSSAEFS